MAVDLSTLTDYTWTQIKLAAKHAMVQSAVGGSSLSINGRQIARISIDEAKKLYNMACEMETIEGGGNDASGIALIEFREPNT
jgi:hypothetical protein